MRALVKKWHWRSLYTSWTTKEQTEAEEDLQSFVKTCNNQTDAACFLSKNNPDFRRTKVRRKKMGNLKKSGKMWNWRGVLRIEMFRHQTMVHYIKHEPTHDVGSLQEGSQSRNEKTYILGWRRSLEEMILKVWRMDHGWTTCAKYSNSKENSKITVYSAEHCLQEEPVLFCSESNIHVRIFW